MFVLRVFSHLHDALIAWHVSQSTNKPTSQGIFLGLRLSINLLRVLSHLGFEVFFVLVCFLFAVQIVHGILHGGFTGLNIPPRTSFFLDPQVPLNNPAIRRHNTSYPQLNNIAHNNIGKLDFLLVVFPPNVT
jgi:hypothetical protein